MSHNPVPVLIVVKGGVAEIYQPRHARAILVDCDDISQGGDLFELPKGIGFEKLVQEAGLVKGKHYKWEEEETDESTSMDRGPASGSPGHH